MRYTLSPGQDGFYIAELSGSSVINSSILNYPGAQLNGSTSPGYSYLPTSTKILSTADFNGDGSYDMFIEYASGDLAIWYLSSTVGFGQDVNSAMSSGSLSVSDDYVGLGAVYTNSNGTATEVMRSEGSTSAHGDVIGLNASGSSIVSTLLGTVSDTAQYIGAADLNGDGKQDLVWQDSGTDLVTIWWSGSQSNSTTVQLTTQLTSINALAHTLIETPPVAYSTATLEGVNPSQIALYDNILGAATVDESTLPGSLTIDLRIPTGQSPTPGIHVSNVVANNSGDTIYAGPTAGTLTGGTGNDIFNGGTSGDTFIGGGGVNTMIGGGGADTYEISSTDIVDTIANGISTNNTASGQADFLGSSDQNLWFMHSSNNLVVDVLGTSDQVVLQNWYANNYSQVSEITDSSGLKLDSALNNLVTAMATFSANNFAFNPQASGTTMPTDTTLQNTITASWHA